MRLLVCMALGLGGCALTSSLEQMPQAMRDVATLKEPMEEVAVLKEPMERVAARDRWNRSLR